VLAHRARRDVHVAVAQAEEGGLSPKRKSRDQQAGRFGRSLGDPSMRVWEMSLRRYAGLAFTTTAIVAGGYGIMLLVTPTDEQLKQVPTPPLLVFGRFGFRSGANDLEDVA
jgi:hypothetical protein